MKKKLSERFIVIYEFIKGKLDQKVIIFIIFLFISTVFWFLTALNHEFSTTIRYPVRYINFPSDKILVNNPPTHFDLLVQSYGYTILKQKLRPGKKRIIFNVNTYPMANLKGSKTKYYVLTTLARDKISNQIPSGLHLLEIKPDSIIFEFSKAINKKIKVKPNVEVALEKQYLIKNGIIANPDSILVSGPKNIIDTLKYVYTKFQKFNKVDEPVKKTLPLIEPEYVIYDNYKVEIEINVEQYTETFVTVPINMAYTPDSLSMKVFPNSVTIYFNIALSDFNKIKPNFFNAVVDFNEINFNKENQPEFLNVKLTRYPDFVQAIRYNPKKVEYIIKKHD